MRRFSGVVYCSRPPLVPNFPVRETRGAQAGWINMDFFPLRKKVDDLDCGNIMKVAVSSSPRPPTMDYDLGVRHAGRDRQA